METTENDRAVCQGQYIVWRSDVHFAYKLVNCPDREECRRYLDRQRAGKYTEWVLAPPPEDGRKCEHQQEVLRCVGT